MAITYTPTLEEYGEYHTASLPRGYRKEWVGGICVLALCLGTWGIFALVTDDLAGFLLREPFGTLTIVSVTLFGVSIPFLSRFFERRKLRAAIKAGYPLFSHPNTFSFDGEGWRLECEHGTYQHPWSVLYAFRESQNLFILLTRLHGFFIPKRALAEGDLQTLRDAAHGAILGSSLFSVQFRPSLPGYLWTIFRHRWQRPYKRAGMLTMWIVGLAIAGKLLESSLASPKGLSMFLIGLAGVVLLLSIGLEPFNDILRFLENPLPRAIKATVYDRGLLWNLGPQEWLYFFNYQHFSRTDETRWALMLYLGPEDWLILPKSSFSTEQLLQFRQLLTKPQAA